MKTPPSVHAKLTVCFAALALLWLSESPAVAQVRSAVVARTPAEARTARHFETLRRTPPQLLAFLLRMPKGGDLHNHLSGAIYAESYVRWAAEKGLCVNQTTLALSNAPCVAEQNQVLASNALTSSLLYRQLIDAWSMRYWQPGPLSGQNGHDRFFDTFGKFSAATNGQLGPMLAETIRRAAKGRVSYLELMLTPDNGAASALGAQVGWDGNFAATFEKLKATGLDAAVATGVKTLREAEAEKDKLLQCGTPQAEPGCQVTVRYVAQVSRGGALGPVFAQMATGLALANDPTSKIVALNLVQPEDGLLSMQNFSLHMEMLAFLRPRFPQARLSLHAGELAPGVVPPEGLSFHIRESVFKARAERIGHGVDIMHEDEPYELLKEMARRRVLVEICLSSNDGILGVRGAQHPLATYWQYGVPMALATDDEGVARSEMSREFLKAAEEQGLGYLQLKQLARNSLEYAFLSGASWWADARTFKGRPACVNNAAKSCQQFLASSEKARLQQKLEEAFQQFERQF